jgi:hypothetical protein
MIMTLYLSLLHFVDFSFEYTLFLFFVAESSIAGEWDDYSRYAGIDAVELQSPVCYLYSETPFVVCSPPYLSCL